MAYTHAPKYHQVADVLREEITNGVLPPAAPLPSEAQLMVRFDVSRPTARSAIAALRAEGLVTVLHGKGAFVRLATDRPTHTHARAITRTSDTGAPARFADADLDTDQWRPVEDPAHYRADATAELALALGMAEHAPLFVGDRLLTDKAGRRLSHRLYVPVATCVDIPALTEDPFRTPGELYGILTAAGHHLAFTDAVRAKMPTPDDAATLRVPDATPMLLIRRTITATPAADQPNTTPVVLAMEETRLSAEDTQLSYPVIPTVITDAGPRLTVV